MSLAIRPLPCLAVAAITSVLSLAPSARADGGFPRANDIFFEPGDPSHILIRSDYWGLFRTTDGGQSWQYACSELYGGSSKSGTRVSLAYLPGGRILVPSSSARAIRMTDDYCNWSDNASLTGHFIGDVVMNGTTVVAVTSDNTDSGISTSLWSSSDNGSTWAPTGAALPGGFFAKSIRVAPSDPQRIYVGGTSVGSTSAVVAQSTNGGTSWTTTTFAPSSGSFSVRIRAVGPTRPDVVFAWIDNDDPAQPDSIWGTGDAGVTWTNVYTSQAPATASVKDLPGLALSPDGTEIRIAGQYDGLLGATVDAALSQGPSAFQKVFDGQVWGLTWTADALYAGNNNFTGEGIPAFTLGKSTDGGKTFSPLMSICSLELATCGSSSSLESTCHPVWDAPGGLKPDFVTIDRCTAPADAAADAGTSHEVSSGCSCTLASREPGGRSAVAGLSVFAIAVAARRTRRRRR